MLGATYKQKYIGDSTFVANENIELMPSVTLNKGAQFTRPINLNGYYSLQSMLTYGFPLDLIRSNINVSIAANYTNTPTVFNGVTSDTRELNLIPKIIIGSNINKNIDLQPLTLLPSTIYSVHLMKRQTTITSLIPLLSNWVVCSFGGLLYAVRLAM